MSSWRVATQGLVLVVCVFLAWPDHGYGRSRAGPRFTITGRLAPLCSFSVWAIISPGLSEFGSRMAQHGIPTTIRNYGNWPALAQEAIQQYQSGPVARS